MNELSSLLIAYVWFGDNRMVCSGIIIIQVTILILMVGGGINWCMHNIIMASFVFPDVHNSDCNKCYDSSGYC